MFRRPPMPAITGPLEAAKFQTIAGRDFDVGARVPWKELGLDQAKAQVLVSQRVLRPATKELHIPDSKVKLPPLKEKPAAEVEAVARAEARAADKAKAAQLVRDKLAAAKAKTASALTPPPAPSKTGQAEKPASQPTQ